MSKLEKRICLLYPAAFSDEKHKLVTMFLTGDGGFHLLGEWEIGCDLIGLVNWICGIQEEDPYRLWIVDSYGVNQAVMDALADRGLPVLSMQYMSKAIDELLDGGLTKLKSSRPYSYLGHIVSEVVEAEEVYRETLG